MGVVSNRATSVCPERSRAPSQINRPCEPEFAQAYASCLRCGSWRSDLERRGGLCRRGRQRWQECGEGAGARDRMMESCRDSLPLRVTKKSLNAETQTAQRKIKRMKERNTTESFTLKRWAAGAWRGIGLLLGVDADVVD